MKSLFLLAILLVSFTFSSAQSEQAPILEKTIKYKDWTYKSVRDGKEINLRGAMTDKKLVMVVYFAPWCGNWKHEAPFAQKLYEKYKANGFQVIGVGEYDPIDSIQNSLKFFNVTFPVVYESESREAKQKTLHYDYRKSVGDTRSWGSPWNIFLEPAIIEKRGDTLVKKASIVSGELIELEAEKFVRQKLGLPSLETKSENKDKAIEVCDPEKKTIVDFKKP